MSAQTKVNANAPKGGFVRWYSPGVLDREFLGAAFGGLYASLRALRGQTGLAPGSVVDELFAGVAVAVPASGAEAEAALAWISELGIRAVRLDYAYHNDSAHLDGFVDKLAESGVSLLLHLVQPMEDAREMPGEAALERWRAFVVASFERFADRFEAIEIGTTINRFRWAGYNLAGFLAAWTAAHEEARRRGVTLVGPNVTDFEPQYNAGLLGMFARRGVLPDVHSNNMFSERTIEPEALDHKIAGHFGKRFLDYNLIKKLRLLAAIAARCGVPRNWSTCAFWTVPRIERILADPEVKMADYLTRYFVLCAAAGSFERIYWGPLVSRREGLLDDGTDVWAEPGRRDVVAFYREYPGAVDQWRKRPAFDALKAIVERIPGATYRGSLAAGPSLQIHAFEKGADVFHVAWTMNGCIADIRQCYGADAISAVTEIFGQNGERLESTPLTLGESPVYLYWPKEAAPSVINGADVYPETRVVPIPDAENYYPVAEGPWRGLIRAASEAEARLLFDALHPDRIGARPERHSLRKARNAIWTVDDPRQSERLLVLKQPMTLAWHKRILDRGKPSKALRSWNGACELLRRGIPTPKPVAYFEHGDRGEMFSNWYVCEHFEGNLSVRSFFLRYAKGESTFEGWTLEAFSEALVPFIRNMHWRGVFFRDLSGGNVLVRVNPDGSLDFSLIDTARARFANRRFPLSDRISDLKRLVHKLNPDQQEYVMNMYLRLEGKRFGLRHRMAFAAYALKARLKRAKRRIRKQFKSAS